MAETHLITRCPACTTAFRASESQLSARGGQVRCGRCATVFDARAYALPEIAEASPVEPLILTPTPTEALPHEIEPEVPPLPMAIKLTDANLEFDFGRPKRAALGQHRWLAVSSIFVLVVALALQLGFHFRGDIALLFPDLKPAMEDLCAQAGCSLPLPRRADMMSIESSDLQADTLNPAVMVLSATLRNRAPFAQASPALELTLTDAQDQPLARRVLTSADYASRAGAAAPGLTKEGKDDGFAPGTELPVKIYFDTSAVQATGYRLYLFYP